jgi:hypothetical protein
MLGSRRLSCDRSRAGATPQALAQPCVEEIYLPEGVWANVVSFLDADNQSLANLRACCKWGPLSIPKKEIAHVFVLSSSSKLATG